MADINAVDLTAETLSSLDGTENVVGFDTAEGKKIPISVLADYAIQKKTQTIAGSTQTVKAAVDALNSNTSYNAYISTSSNGSFASLCGETGTYAIYVSDTSNKYCYGQFTIVKGSSRTWAMIANSGITLSASNNQGTLVFTGGTGTYTAKVTRQSFVPSNATTEELNSKLTQPSSQTLTFGDKSWYFYKIGRLIIVMAPGDIKSASSGVNTVGTLPEAFRPNVAVCVGNQNALNDNQQKYYLTVGANGAVSFYTPVAISSAQNCSISGCYMSKPGT